MYMSACLMYEDIDAQLLQEKDSIHLILYSRGHDIALSFSYPQVKALADGCATLLANLKVCDLAESSGKNLKGELKLKADIAEGNP